LISICTHALFSIFRFTTSTPLGTDVGDPPSTSVAPPPALDVSSVSSTPASNCVQVVPDTILGSGGNVPSPRRRIRPPGPTQTEYDNSKYHGLLHCVSDIQSNALESEKLVLENIACNVIRIYIFLRNLVSLETGIRYNCIDLPEKWPLCWISFSLTLSTAVTLSWPVSSPKHETVAGMKDVYPLYWMISLIIPVSYSIWFWKVEDSEVQCWGSIWRPPTTHDLSFVSHTEC